MVANVGHRCAPLLLFVLTGLAELCLVQTKCLGLFQPLLVSIQQRLAVGHDGTIDYLPTALQLLCHAVNSSTFSPDLLGGPFRSARSQKTIFGGYPMIGEHPAFGGTRDIRTAHAMLVPDQPKWGPEYRQIDIGDDRPVLDVGHRVARCTADFIDDLFDHQFGNSRGSPVLQNPYVLQSDESFANLARVAGYKGAFSFVGHTSSMKHPCAFQADIARIF